jgi:hypothetical protein
VKKTRGDEAIRVVVHICIETTHGNSLYSNLYLKLAKMSCFSFYFLSFFLLHNWRTTEQKRFCEGGGWLASVGGRGDGERGRNNE